MRAIAVICPGFHPPSLTDSFVAAIDWQGLELLVFPSHLYPAYSGMEIYNFLNRSQANKKLPLIFIGFSAGVVGAMAATWLWQLSGGKVKAIVAFDGWGVPLFSNVEIHRFSHDRFTHITSAWLGTGKQSFYADPPVLHLDLWRSPHLTAGYLESSSEISPYLHQPTTAAIYLQYLLAVIA